MSFPATEMTTPLYCPFSRTKQASQYQNVSVLDFIGAKDDGGGGDNWSYVQSCGQTVTINKQTPSVSRAVYHSCRPTNSVKALMGKITTFRGLALLQLTWGSSNPVSDH